jgi:hypothetical protein
MGPKTGKIALEMADAAGHPLPGGTDIYSSVDANEYEARLKREVLARGGPARIDGSTAMDIRAFGPTLSVGCYRIRNAKARNATTAMLTMTRRAN